MKKARWVTAAVGTAVLSAGFVLPGATAAYADTGGNGNGGLLSVLSGNSVTTPVSLPVNVCGVSLGVLGGADSGCQGGSSSSTTINGSGGGQSDSGNAGLGSILSGNSVTAPVSVPVNVCGVSAAVAGSAQSGCRGGSESSTTIGSSGGNGSHGQQGSGGGNGNGGNGNGGNGNGGNGNAGVASVLSGNTVNAPISAPVNVCGIALAALGFADAGCQGGSSSSTTINGSGGGQGDNGNAGLTSVLSGNTVNAPISAPVNVCGVSLAVIGQADSSCQGGSQTVVNQPPAGSNPTPCQTSQPPTWPGNHGQTPPTNHNTPSGGNWGGNNGGGSNGGSNNGGSQNGNGAGTATTVAAESLPITGANLFGMLVAALGSLGFGVTSLVIARRRRRIGEAA